MEGRKWGREDERWEGVVDRVGNVWLADVDQHIRDEDGR